MARPQARLRIILLESKLMFLNRRLKEAGLEVNFQWFDYSASMDAFSAGKLDLGGISLVAADPHGAIAGFQLAEYRRMLPEPEAICLDYSGISEAARNKGIYREFIKQQQGRGLRLRIEVLPENNSVFGAMLTRYGFHRLGKTVYVWEPDIKATQRKSANEWRRSSQRVGARLRFAFSAGCRKIP
jgi:hypothetical protein